MHQERFFFTFIKHLIIFFLIGINVRSEYFLNRLDKHGNKEKLAYLGIDVTHWYQKLYQEIEFLWFFETKQFCVEYSCHHRFHNKFGIYWINFSTYMWACCTIISKSIAAKKCWLSGLHVTLRQYNFLFDKKKKKKRFHRSHLRKLTIR